jgi:cyclopropane fatty-acyl-phospholipid synthase-like methyltransferase
MTAAGAAQDQLLPASGGERSGIDRWTAHTVAWYERANAGSNYADQVLRAAREPLAGAASVLDVGAGFGALALPLARRGLRVTALEPAPAMAEALRRAARAAGHDTVTVIEARWGAVPLAPHDVVLCARVGAALGPGPSFLARVDALAARAVLVVRDAPDLATSSFTDNTGGARTPV